MQWAIMRYEKPSIQAEYEREAGEESCPGRIEETKTKWQIW